MATGLLLLRLVLALSKLLLREFFELLDATYTKISPLSTVFLNEQVHGTSSSPSCRRETKGGGHAVLRCLLPHMLKLLVTIFNGKVHQQ